MGIPIYQMCCCDSALYVLIPRASIYYAVNPLIDQWVKPMPEMENQLHRPEEPQMTNQLLEPIDIDVKSTALLVIGGAL